MGDLCESRNVQPTQPVKISRRNFLRLGAASGVAVGGSGVYSRYIEPRDLETTFKRIHLGLRGKIRILHLSDFHASSCVPWSLIQRSIEIGLSHHPDLVFLTGDFITGQHYEFHDYPKFIASLKGQANCFACLGNHDGKYITKRLPATGMQLEKYLGEVGVKLLQNKSAIIHVKGNDLKIAGLGDLWQKEVRPELCLEALGKTSMTTLLLAHNPDTKTEVADYHWDVMFSGHTHGGQVVVPLLNWAPALPVKDRSMVAGVYPWKDRHIHITRGVGSLHGVRFNCRPEVSVIDLV